MQVETTPLQGVLVLRPRVFKDDRGYFVETWTKNRYAAAGIEYDFVQDNHSSSRQGVLRGLHFQNKQPQGKLVSVSYGRVWDVAVDLRPQSPSFGQYFGLELNAEEQTQFWIPPGLAHGFCVLSELAHLHYKCTDYYVPGDDGEVAWNDPDLNINWPLANPLLSAKDAAAQSFRQWQEQFGA